MAKSERLYKDSPKIEKDEDGKPGIKKPSKADGESMSIEGNPLPGEDGEMPVSVQEMHERHSREMKDMHKRHQDEQKDMHKRHTKEHNKLSGSKTEKDED